MEILVSTIIYLFRKQQSKTSFLPLQIVNLVYTSIIHLYNIIVFSSPQFASPSFSSPSFSSPHFASSRCCVKMDRRFPSLSRFKKRSSPRASSVDVPLATEGYRDPRRDGKGPKRQFSQPMNTLVPLRTYKKKRKDGDQPGRNESNEKDRKVKNKNEKEEKNVKENEEEEIFQSDSDSQLIDLSLLSSSPTRDRGNELDEIAKLIQESEGDAVKDESAAEDTRLKGPVKTIGASNLSLNLSLNLSTNEEEFSSFPTLMQSLQRKVVESSAEIADRFKEYGIPPPVTSKRELAFRVKRHLHVARNVLSQKKGSRYYDSAKQILNQSRHDTMTLKEKQEIDWNIFHGGYYGLKRQLFIGNIIVSQLHEALRASAGNCREISYWTINGFSSFVLASEVILSMIMEDFKCDRKKAENIARETVDYGKAITDTREITDDMDVGELLHDESKEFMKDIPKK